ncbi:MAG: hypothetical protein JO287_12335 [Pseudonocardiales bacterium]|nr:hypothetical protein [Pseudonocardiales bacterium]
MATIAHHAPATDSDSDSVSVLASAVLAVVMRVAGPVPQVHPHALGQPEQQVSARIGDAVVYLTEPAVAERIRQQWDASQYLVSQRLPERVSQTWLLPTPGSYPLSVALRLTGAVEVATQWVDGRRETRTPPTCGSGWTGWSGKSATGRPGGASVKPGSTRNSTSPSSCQGPALRPRAVDTRGCPQLTRSALPHRTVSGHAAPHDYHPVYDWAITAIGAHNTTPHRSGRADKHAAAWTAALAVPRCSPAN